MKKDFLWFLLLSFFSLLMFYLDHRGWLKTARGWLERPVLGVEEKIYSRWRGPALGGETSRGCIPRVLELEERLRQLAVKNNEFASCLEENEKMKKLLGAPLPPSWKFLPAKVIGLSGQMRLDKGEKDGVSPGMMVVSENILVGRVSSVEVYSSLVTLPITPNTKIPVVIKSPHSAEATRGRGVQGRGILTSLPGQKLLLDKVLQEEDIQPGDLVVTVADWLPDLLIGQVEEVLTETVEIYKKARVSLLIDYQSLRIVFIVVKS